MCMVWIEVKSMMTSSVAVVREAVVQTAKNDGIREV